MHRVGAALAAAVSLFVLSACTGENTAPQSSTPSPAQSITPSPDLSAVKVAEGTPPKVTVPAPWAITKTQTKVFKPGTGEKVTEASRVGVKYIGVNGRTGKVFDSSYTKGQPVNFKLSGVVPGFSKGLAGQRVGSRVLVGITGEDGYPEGSPEAGIEKGDTLVFYIDIVSASHNEAKGTPVTPAAGLPTVTIKDGKPEIGIPPGSAAPKDLKVQPLIKGTGGKITEASNIQVKFRSWVYADGKKFVDGWDKAQESPVKKLIPGWQKGLIGQTVGSRVLLVVPPALAFPQGLPASTPTLAPNQTLVYVIDILDATTQPQ